MRNFNSPLLSAATVLAALLAPSQRPSLATTSSSSPSASPLPSSHQQSKPSARRVTVLCVDAQGKPVPKAEVYLFQELSEQTTRYEQSGPFSSDEQGRALCAEAIFSTEHGNFDRWIYARVPGQLIGTARGAKWTNRAPINAEMRVTLLPSRSIDGKITVPPGIDPTKVMIRTRYLNVINGPGFFDFASFPRHDPFLGLDTALPERFDCRPDNEGRIHFSDVPVKGELTLVSTGAGLAEAQWRNQGKIFDQPIQMTIARESLVTGRVLTPDGTPAAGAEVIARLAPPPEKQVYFLTSFRTVTAADGTFALHALPQIQFVLKVHDASKRLAFRPLENVLVEPEKDPHLTLRLETGTLVSGTVLDPDGKPVEGAALSAVADTKLGPGLDDAMTPATGKYQLRLPPGGANLYFNSLPDGFAYPRPQVIKHLDIEPGQPDIKNLDFKLERQAKPAR